MLANALMIERTPNW